MFGSRSSFRSARGNRLAAVLGAAALSLALAAPASAEAIVTRDTVTTPIFETGLPDDCRPGITGTLDGTDVFSYQSVETPQGFHIAGTITDTGRITWSDGTYSIVESVDHFSFTTGKGITVLTLAHEDSGNTYTAAGVFLYRVTLHLVEHFTVTDGVVRVEFVRGHFHAFGEC